MLKHQQKTKVTNIISTRASAPATKSASGRFSGNSSSVTEKEIPLSATQANTNAIFRIRLGNLRDCAEIDIHTINPVKPTMSITIFVYINIKLNIFALYHFCGICTGFIRQATKKRHRPGFSCRPNETAAIFLFYFDSKTRYSLKSVPTKRISRQWIKYQSSFRFITAKSF